MARKASLKRRTLRNPAAKAISDIGIWVSLRSRLAFWTRRVAATSVGVAPVWRTNSRNKWRDPIPSRSASSATEASFRNPASIRRTARATVVAVPLQAGLPGAVSGRQRRHGRNLRVPPRLPSRRRRRSPNVQGAPGRPVDSRSASFGRQEYAVEGRISRQPSAVAYFPVKPWRQSRNHGRQPTPTMPHPYS